MFHRDYSLTEETVDTSNCKEVVTTFEFDKRLIDQVRINPIIYMDTRKRRSEQFLRTINSVWDVIAKNCQSDVLTCQNRWVQLKKLFSKERHRIHDENMNSKMKPAPAIFQYLTWLDNYMEKRSSQKKNKIVEDKGESRGELNIQESVDLSDNIISLKNDFFDENLDHSNYENEQDNNEKEAVDQQSFDESAVSNESPISSVQNATLNDFQKDCITSIGEITKRASILMENNKPKSNLAPAYNKQHRLVGEFATEKLEKLSKKEKFKEVNEVKYNICKILYKD